LRLYFVTHNKGKFEEAYRILEPYGVELVPTELKKIELQSDDVAEIALNAAINAYSILREPVVVDDTGFFINSLNGFPGPYAEYVYRTIGIEGILKLMQDVVNRRAYFETAVAIVYPPWEKVFKERVEGRISTVPRGTGGFGFDPIFIPYGQDKTFAEMGIEEKNQYSHRGRALHRLGKWITLIGKREKIR
jgi:XTP/dITP diphosphohydrolase